jgi:hypothetical protein
MYKVVRFFDSHFGDVNSNYDARYSKTEETSLELEKLHISTTESKSKSSTIGRFTGYLLSTSSLFRTPLQVASHHLI